MKLYQLKNKIRNFFIVVISDPRRKSLPLMTWEYMNLFFTNRLAFDQYFDKLMYRKGNSNFSNYRLPDRLQYAVWRINDKVYVPILDNKYVFERFFGMHGLKVIKSHARNDHTVFFQEGQVFQINNAEAFASFVQKLISERSATRDIFIKKNSASCGGKGIYLLKHGDLLNPSLTENVYKNVIGSEFLFQERLVQHNEFNKLNPDCINSIRIDTFMGRDGVARPISAFVRMSVGGAYVDNISSGGIFAGIDPVKGVLYPEAFSNFTDGRGKTFSFHPDTGTRFEGFKVPLYHEAEALALKAASCIPQVRLIGWDIAITPEGPVLIEGNDTPGMSASEIAVYGYKDNPVLKDLVDEVIERRL